MKLSFLWLLALIIFLLSACATQQESKKVAPHKPTEIEIKDYRDAESIYKSRKLNLALKKFYAYVQKHPGTELTANALYYMGQIYYDSGDYFRAAKYWLAIVDGE